VRIVADELSRTFGNTHALSDVSIALDPGKIHALVGENGAEKSTLLKILAGAEQPDSGRMVVDGEPYAPRSVMDATGRGVGLVFQEITINPSLTVAENIFAGRLAGFRRHGLLRGSGDYAADEVSRDQIQSLMVGRDLSKSLFPPHAAQASSDNLMRFDDVADERLEPSSLTLGGGEIVGIAGLKGAGGQRILEIAAGVAPAPSIFQSAPSWRSLRWSLPKPPAASAS